MGVLVGVSFFWENHPVDAFQAILGEHTKGTELKNKG
jgi:hypothetical protein